MALAIIIAWENLVEDGKWPEAGFNCLVENHVQNHADMMLMKCQDHAFEFRLPGGAVRVTSVRTFRSVVKHRVVAPAIPSVFVNLLPLITTGIVIHWQEMNMCDSEFFQVIQSAFLALWSFCSRFDHSQVFTPI